MKTLSFADARAFQAWLASHYDSCEGLWLKLPKKGTGVPSVSYAQAIEAALVWGWIDGQKQRLDEKFWLQKFCPRAVRSLWSKLNREKASALSAALDKSKRAAAAFAKIDGSNRYAILWRVQTAKKPETRARRIDELVAMLARGELLHPQRAKKTTK